MTPWNADWFTQPYEPLLAAIRAELHDDPTEPIEGYVDPLPDEPPPPDVPQADETPKTDEVPE